MVKGCVVRGSKYGCRGWLEGDGKKGSWKGVNRSIEGVVRLEG